MSSRIDRTAVVRRERGAWHRAQRPEKEPGNSELAESDERGISKRGEIPGPAARAGVPGGKRNG
jgi:hypothetical protein